MLIGKNWANFLSLSRIPLGVVFIFVYETGDPTAYLISLVIIGLALLSDIFDGKIARATNTASKTGYFIDGLGDKAFYIAFYLVILSNLPSTEILCWLLIVREVFLYGLRSLTDNLAAQLQALRKYSLLHAFFVRSWFLVFLAYEGLVLSGITFEFLPRFGLIMAGLACISAYWGLYLQIKQFQDN